MSRKQLILPLALLSLSLGGALAAPDTIYHGGAILTMAGTEPAYVEALAVEAGKITFAGTKAEALALKDDATRLIDLAGKEFGPDQRITAYEGLKAMTEWAAEQYGEETAKGSLATGKLADLVILDRDPLIVDPAAIRDIRVLATIKEGRTIHTTPRSVASGQPEN